ncbi:MAG: AsmA family protein [Pelovirga sp.]
MSKPVKTILFVSIGVMVLFALVTVGLLLYVGTDASRTRVETAASQALGMEVRVGGSLGINLWKGLHITLKDVHLVQQGTDVARVEKISLGIELLPLLQNNVHIRTLALKQPRITIERDQDGTFNDAKTRLNGDSDAALGWSNVSMTEGTLIFSDQQSGVEFEASDCSLTADQLQPADGQVANRLKDLAFTAELACGVVRVHDLTLSAVAISASGQNGIIDLEPVTMQVFAASGAGRLRADLTGAVPLYDLHYELPAFSIEAFFKSLSQPPVATGVMDFSADISTQGKTLDEIRQTLRGKVSLRGEDIKLLGHDLDAQFANFESSQNFNLIDVGAFFFAGPLGLLVTKGYNFASNLQGPAGNSAIRTLVSDWQIEQGVARAQDVALATAMHRVALKGGLDLVSETFDDLTMALIDADGCTQVSQSIHGSFHDPQVEKPSLLRALAGPVENVLMLGIDLLPGGECEPFYTGSVDPPQ